MALLIFCRLVVKVNGLKLLRVSGLVEGAGLEVALPDRDTQIALGILPSARMIFFTRFECSFHIFFTRFECICRIFSTRFECSFHIFSTRLECSFQVVTVVFILSPAVVAGTELV